MKGVAMGLRAGVGLLAVLACLAAFPTFTEAETLWQGTVAGDQANVRSAPAASAPVVDVLDAGTPVTVATWVSGDEVQPTNNTWAKLTSGGYVYSALIHKDQPKAAPPVPGGPQYQGKWLDANLTQQVITAYVGSTPVHVAVMSSGRPDYPTPIGSFSVLRRVANETMDSTSVPWVRDHYRLENVLFTQYFTSMGAAIHEAWWKTPDSFGIPTSHACIGLPFDEAQWFWNWATEGTPVYVHQ
ncbi:MAG TPA: L,D-transpeptidase family protein [Chloroflexota bacterium]|nr:L,D-transpeptidase family protein [Chloroflexota bacterium]